jgi:hypothetical protein
MALTFDIRQPVSTSSLKDVRSKAGHCLALGSIVSSFAFILALVVGFL